MEHLEHDCDSAERPNSLPEIERAFPDLDPTLWPGLDPWLGDWREAD